MESKTSFSINQQYAAVICNIFETELSILPSVVKQFLVSEDRYDMGVKTFPGHIRATFRQQFRALHNELDQLKREYRDKRLTDTGSYTDNPVLRAFNILHLIYSFHRNEFRILAILKFAIEHGEEPGFVLSYSSLFSKLVHSHCVTVHDGSDGIEVLS